MHRLGERSCSFVSIQEDRDIRAWIFRLTSSRVYTFTMMLYGNTHLAGSIVAVRVNRTRTYIDSALHGTRVIFARSIATLCDDGYYTEARAFCVHWRAYAVHFAVS